jgi:hypothetical protein
VSRHKLRTIAILLLALLILLTAGFLRNGDRVRTASPSVTFLKPSLARSGSGHGTD